ncbi:MAG: TRAP transporter substrate-binding protein DctP [Candidatus Goldbacteria bacterium]|nr:TRAP transporter substrate-binding protein DctP [Candidatus Goldiibacteriota bacterium]
MKKIFLLTLIFALPFSVFSAPIEIKFATVAPDGSTWMNVMHELNDTIMEKTDGSVKFKFYPGGVSGDEIDVLRKMGINQIHAAGFTSQGLGEVVKESRILNVPLLIKNEEEVDYVMSKMAPYFEKQFEKKGYIVLGWPEVGFAYVFSKKKIDSIESFKKIKMWIWGEDVLVNTLFRNIGIVPIPLSLIDVMQSLQTGMIEGVYGSPLSAVAMQWQTMVKYMLDMKIAYIPGGVLIKQNVWNKIPEKYRSIIMEESKKSFDKLTQLSRKENNEALDALKKSGVVFTDITNEADIKAFEEVSKKTATDLIGKFYTKELLDEINKHLSDVRSKSIKKEK